MGVNPAQAMAGVSNAERAVAKDVERSKDERTRVRARRVADEVELSGGAQTAEGVRVVKDPTQEEGKEDRDAKERYGGRGAKGGSKDGPRRLDVSG